MSKQPPKSGTKKLYLAGGIGAEGLKQELLFNEQQLMFQRTLVTSAFQRRANEQELRQINILKPKYSLTVNVSREDFPSISADIDVGFVLGDAQLMWKGFLIKVKAALKCEYIEYIIDRADGSKVFRVMKLTNGGKYFARQAEKSALIEMIHSGNVPPVRVYKSLDIIKELNQDFAAASRFQTHVDAKAHEMLHRPMTWHQEFSASSRIISATSTREVIQVVESFVVGKEGGIYSAMSDSELSNIDLISLHRLALECLNRIAIKSDEKCAEVASQGLDFILNVMKSYQGEIDVVILALRLLSEVAISINPSAEPQVTWNLLFSVMDIIQYYAPIRPDYREKKAPLRIGLLAAKEAKKKELRQFRKTPEANRDSDHPRDSTATAGPGQPVKNSTTSLVSPLMDEVVGINPAATTETDGDISPIPLEAQTERNQPLAPAQSTISATTILPPAGKVKAWKGSVGISAAGKRKEIKVVESAFASATVEKSMTKEERWSSLPKVPGSKFTGLSKLGPQSYKRNMTLMQGFSTLYKLATCRFSTRCVMFDMGIQYEIADLAFYAEDQPRLLAYVLWILDVLYRDQFASGSVLESFEEDFQVIALPTAFLNEVGALVNKDLRQLFEDSHGTHDELNSHSHQAITESSANATSSIDTCNSHGKRRVAYRITADVCRANSPSTVLVDQAHLQDLGYFVFRDRYLNPHTACEFEDVIVALALAAFHSDVDGKDRSLASRWLQYWNDTSRRFQYLVKRGRERTGCNVDFDPQLTTTEER